MTVDGAYPLCVRDGEKETLETHGDTLTAKNRSGLSKSKATSSCGFGEGY